MDIQDALALNTCFDPRDWARHERRGGSRRDGSFPQYHDATDALQVRLAQERGEPLPGQSGTALVGELYRPAGTRPFPAVVGLHGCLGRGSKQSEDAIGARFANLATRS